jgi:hypothetical protein
MKKTALVKRWFKDLEKDRNLRELELIRQSGLTPGKLLSWMRTRAIFVIIAVLVAACLYYWNNREESQINIVLFESFGKESGADSNSLQIEPYV